MLVKQDYKTHTSRKKWGAKQREGRDDRTDNAEKGESQTKS